MKSLTVKTLLETKPALEVLGNLKFVSTAQSFRLATYMRKITTPLEIYEQERLRLVREYGVPVEGDDTRYTIPPENVADFTTAMLEMESEEVEGLIPPSLSLSDLRKDTEVKPLDLFPLVGTVLLNSDHLDHEHRSITVSRNQLLMIYAGLRTIGAQPTTNHLLAHRLMCSLYRFAVAVEAFRQEEMSLTGTPEEKGTKLAALYDKDNTYAMYNVAIIPLAELEGLEIEPVALMQIEPIIEESIEETSNEPVGISAKSVQENGPSVFDHRHSGTSANTTSDDEDI